LKKYIKSAPIKDVTSTS